jgi:cytochrome c
MSGTMSRLAALYCALAMTATAASPAAAETSLGDTARGVKQFGACAACHSLVADRNMTGPSLAGVWGRKAGSLKSFDRYSTALKNSGVVWDEKSLEAWLKSPAEFIPGNRMAFAGITDAAARTDIAAFLKAVSNGERPVPAAMTRPLFQDLKKLGAAQQVTAIRYCRDTYHITTADGQVTDFWEANLRFKTDSSGTGPPSGKPVMLPAGMIGDRASVFFAAPDEISDFIKHRCRGEP